MRLQIREKGIILSFILILAGFASFGQDARRTDTRQQVQRARIVDGRKDGEVTRREGARLNMEQRHIRRAERRAVSDGEVTPNEKRRLQRKQNRASRHIRRAKHNEVDNN
ncbi:MAG: hypothetical protein RIA63_00575 [Cyclobacteriaceae bacterium]